MDWDKLVNVILNSFKVAIVGIGLGVLGTYLVYDTVVLPGKNSELATLHTAVEVEKGRQNVLGERIKLLGDKAVFLESQLKYKPMTQKALEAESLAKIEKLEKENIQLYEIKANFEKVEGSKVESAKLSAELERYMAENARLQSLVSQFSSDELVNENKIIR